MKVKKHEVILTVISVLMFAVVMTAVIGFGVRNETIMNIALKVTGN
jgi:hypothetical protein